MQALVASEANHALLQGGHHTANAGLESLLHMEVKAILTLGCDSAHVCVRYVPRADKAIGESPRDLSYRLQDVMDRLSFLALS